MNHLMEKTKMRQTRVKEGGKNREVMTQSDTLDLPKSDRVTTIDGDPSIRTRPGSSTEQRRNERAESETAKRKDFILRTDYLTRDASSSFKEIYQ